MKKTSLSILILSIVVYYSSSAQSSLTIEKIMQGEYFTGFSPENIQWSPQGKIFFSWNPAKAPVRSTFACEPGGKPAEASTQQKKDLPGYGINYNNDRSKAVWSKDGDLFMLETKTGKVTRLTSSVSPENSPSFSIKGDKIIFNSQGNIFSLETATGILFQHTDFRPGRERTETVEKNSKDKWLNDDEMRLINTLQERKKRRELSEKEGELLKPDRPKTIYSGTGMISSPQLSPDQNYVTYFTVRPADEKRTIVPNYVTESSYTEEIQSRGKVGTSSYSSGALNIYDIRKDTVYQVATDDIPGIDDKPDYIKDYPVKKPEKGEKASKRGLSLSGPMWSQDGKYAITDLYSEDHKDRWIMLLDINTGKLKLLDRQRDEAWIGGPGIGRGSLGWIDNKTIYFQSEATGYSHLYTIDVPTGEKKALTSGNFEVSDLTLSNDKKNFYFISNETDPGIRELYSMPANGGSRTKLTDTGGAVEFELSPDEKYFALRISTANTPWDLYTMENKKNAKPVRITESATDEFKSYQWRIPEVIRIKASDGASLPARLYKPTKKNGAAVIFVHGAGYLQNAHHWWSQYSREYMFHNFLVDNGYTVLDIDYRGSSGYGRDWRTAIYRYMGGRDLDDHVDGARYLVEQQGIDQGRIGIYGGSYGGFITLMALFTRPGVFAAGAALRPVTDWAHYNHGYTSNILNTPVQDSLSYMRSSPIYYAAGLKDALLICHGMIDDNVHFQDVVRLSQKLIELGKDNWSVAFYPLESHSFIEASSWTDEYRRIYELFEQKLNGAGK